MKRLLRLAAAALILSLVSCGSPAAAGLDGFRNEEGFYAYPGLAWGCTAEEATRVTGWALGQGTDYYSGDGSFAYTAYEAADVSHEGQQWEMAHLQFDEDGGLWCVNLMQTGETDQLKKQFDAMEKELARIYGEPDKAEYDVHPPLADSDVRQNYVDRQVFDREGRLINTFALYFQELKDGETAILGIGVNWKEEGFLIV